MKSLTVCICMVVLLSPGFTYINADFGSHVNGVLSALNRGGIRRPAHFTSANDFDQTRMSSAMIDRRISRTIRGYADRGAKNYEIEIPVNTRKLRYLGFRHPRNLGFFTAQDLGGHLRRINRSFHVYQYGKFRILVQGHGVRDHLNVYHTVRALNILRFRYPKIWTRYFNSMHGVSDRIDLSKTIKRWVNTARATVIAFVNCGAIASNIYDIGPVRGRRFGMPLYHNTHLIYINPIGIYGKDSRYIYRKPDHRLNYAMYLREGIIDSLLHERLHGYISSYKNLSPFLYYVRNHSRNYYLFEELIVNNTSIALLESQGGMSRRYISYYRWMFGRQIRKIGGRLPEYRRFFRRHLNLEPGERDRALFRMDRYRLWIREE